MLFGGALAFLMVLTEYVLVSVTSAATVTIVGAVKEAVTILLTPVLAYWCLVKEDDREAPSFLFESVEPNVQVAVGRYSVVGAQPAMEIMAKENKVTTMDHEFGHLTEEIIEDPMSVPGHENHLHSVVAGKLPDIHPGLYDDVVVFDHVEKKAYVIHWVRLDRFSSAEHAYKDGKERLQKLVSRLKDTEP
ncbi:hypothetical protein K1719_033931 [Acacia pycnantha]|nr:hypothetical protein K1719_033931 [Acacia pycnantha]